MNPLDLFLGKPKQRVASRFFFELTGFMAGGCSKVKNIERKMARDTYQEGGLNEKPVILAVPQNKLDKLILEKAFLRKNPMMRSMSDEPFEQSQTVAPGTLMILNENRLPVRIFYFEKGIISEWSMVDLDAQKPEIMAETITIEHTGLIEMEMSLSGVKKMVSRYL